MPNLSEASWKIAQSVRYCTWIFTENRFNVSNVSSDMRAWCGHISRPLFENTLSTGADEADMQNNDSNSDLRSGCWSHSVDSGRRSVGMVQLTVTMVSPCVMSVAFANCSRIKILLHSHFKWIWLISNDQLHCNQSNRLLTIYCTFCHFGISVCDSKDQTNY